jgi:ketosteroid isomerase-like protein
MEYAEDAALVVKPGMTVKGKEHPRAFIAISDYFGPIDCGTRRDAGDRRR